MSLRERKKWATRLALSQAAIRLALERGLEQVRVEDIAAAAEVSPRTFNNYFSTKEEAFVFLGVERAERIAATLRERPADEPLSVALTQAFVAQYSRAGERDSEWVAQLRLVISAPALRGAYLKTLVASERPLAAAIAARIGADGPDGERELYPRALAAAVSGAARAALMHWLDSGGVMPLVTVIEQAITYVVAGVDHGLPSPPAPARSKEHAEEHAQEYSQQHVKEYADEPGS